MNLRIALGRFLIRSGRFVQSLAVMVMRPRDLVEYGRRTYSRPESIEGWGVNKILAMGLSDDEKALLEKLPAGRGVMLLLGAGGGREAIAFGRMGFDITGVDFIPELLEKAKANARAEGVNMTGLVQEISQLDVPEGGYDVVWLSTGMYSSVPTRKNRVAMLRKIGLALRPGGYFVCQFMCGREAEFSPRWETLRKAFAWLTMGNLRYEKGDRLASNIEFIHYFAAPEELESEFKEGGFAIFFMNFPEDKVRGGAVLRTAVSR